MTQPLAQRVRATLSARSSRSLIAAVVVIAVLVAGFIGAPVGARAAGNAQLDLTISAVDPTSGAPITTARYGVNAVAYRIDYSCSTDTCENTKVKLDPTQLDPNHNYYRLLVQSGFNPPATPASISGSATAGYTVSLGRVAAGQSGQFTVIYSFAPTPPKRVGGVTAESNGWAVATFPDGFEIRQSATITSDTAVAPETATDGGVIYQSVGIGTPGVAQAGPAARVLTETDYTYFVYMTSGCTQSAYHATYGRVVASNEFLCASDYQVVHQLPAGVELVSAGGNPAVSGTVATGLILTWNAPSWTPAVNAEGGWLSLARTSPRRIAPATTTPPPPRGGRVRISPTSACRVSRASCATCRPRRPASR